MRFSDLTRARAHLLQQSLQKEAGMVGAVLKAPFRAAGAVAKAGAKSTMKRNGKIMGGLMVGGAALGTAAVAGSAIGKAKQYNRGFDPRIQAASMQRVQ